MKKQNPNEKKLADGMKRMKEKSVDAAKSKRVLNAIEEMIRAKGIDLADIGAIKKVSIYQQVTKHAEGEFQAAEKLVSAANAIAAEPVAIQLRYLQTLTEIGVEQNTTVVFPIPVQFLDSLTRSLRPEPTPEPVETPVERRRDTQPVPRG